MQETKVVHKEYTLTRDELLEKLGIKGEILVNVDDMLLDNMIVIKTKPAASYRRE